MGNKPISVPRELLEATPVDIWSTILRSKERIIPMLLQLTDEDIQEIDQRMNNHMQGHTASNSPNGWTCNEECRKQALKLAVNGVLEVSSEQFEGEVLRKEAKWWWELPAQKELTPETVSDIIILHSRYPDDRKPKESLGFCSCGWLIVPTDEEPGRKLALDPNPNCPIHSKIITAVADPEAITDVFGGTSSG